MMNVFSHCLLICTPLNHWLPTRWNCTVEAFQAECSFMETNGQWMMTLKPTAAWISLYPNCSQATSQAGSRAWSGLKQAGRLRYIIWWPQAAGKRNGWGRQVQAWSTPSHRWHFSQSHIHLVRGGGTNPMTTKFLSVIVLPITLPFSPHCKWPASCPQKST